MGPRVDSPLTLSIQYTMPLSESSSSLSWGEAAGSEKSSSCHSRTSGRGKAGLREGRGAVKREGGPRGGEAGGEKGEMRWLPHQSSRVTTEESLLAGRS